jgi:hypothetical protein
MFQGSETALIRFKEFAAQLTSGQDFTPSRDKVRAALASLLDEAEVHRIN